MSSYTIEVSDGAPEWSTHMANLCTGSLKFPIDSNHGKLYLLIGMDVLYQMPARRADEFCAAGDSTAMDPVSQTGTEVVAGD